jgi:hypothetical protein
MSLQGFHDCPVCGAKGAAYQDYFCGQCEAEFNISLTLAAEQSRTQRRSTEEPQQVQFRWSSAEEE